MAPRLVAFKGPLRPGYPGRERGELSFAPAHYVPLLRTLGVSCVVPPLDILCYNYCIILYYYCIILCIMNLVHCVSLLWTLGVSCVVPPWDI